MMTYLFIDECSKDVNFTTAFRYPTVRVGNYSSVDNYSGGDMRRHVWCS